MRAGRSPTTRFYDIGLAERGSRTRRGAAAGAAEHAFKTPSLARSRPRARPTCMTARSRRSPMSVRHYVERHHRPSDACRPTCARPHAGRGRAGRAGRVPRHADQRRRPAAAATHRRRAIRPGAEFAHATSISQHDKSFTPDPCRIRRGEKLWLLNNDTRTHNIRVFDAKLDFDSGAQEPGETVEIDLSEDGVLSGVLRHPSEDGASTSTWCDEAHTKRFRPVAGFR